MRMIEKFKDELKEKLFCRCSQSNVEERFLLLMKLLDFAAILSRKGFCVDSTLKRESVLLKLYKLMQHGEPK
jgi:hypothetical protein